MVFMGLVSFGLIMIAAVSLASLSSRMSLPATFGHPPRAGPAVDSLRRPHRAKKGLFAR
jgi:hypothetical protein